MREQAALLLVIAIPFAAVVLAVPLTWGWGISWTVVMLSIFWYSITMLGITVGFHRLITHRSFRVSRPLRVILAIAGSMAIQGPVIRWAADHRRHHAYADKDGDPHSPWRFGTGYWQLIKGMLFAHLGWLFDFEETNPRLFTPDLLADRDMRIVSRLFGLFVVLSLVLPPAMQAAVHPSVRLVIQAFVWASLVRIFMVHHVTWAVNSICHVVGSRPFRTRDRSTNFWPLAILSMGEAWHNGHHAAPSCARHGVRRGEIDISARLIYLLERTGWATSVKWPRRQPAAEPLIAAGRIQEDSRASR